MSQEENQAQSNEFSFPPGAAREAETLPVDQVAGANRSEENQAEQSESASSLTELEQEIIALEKKRWKYPAAKEQAIREQVGLSAIAYYQKLNKMIDDPRVIAHEPALTRRLRGHREFT